MDVVSEPVGKSDLQPRLEWRSDGKRMGLQAEGQGCEKAPE